jgi:hypothetical protein
MIFLSFLIFILKLFQFQKLNINFLHSINSRFIPLIVIFDFIKLNHFLRRLQHNNIIFEISNWHINYPIIIEFKFYEWCVQSFFLSILYFYLIKLQYLIWNFKHYFLMLKFQYCFFKSKNVHFKIENCFLIFISFKQKPKLVFLIRKFFHFMK